MHSKDLHLLEVSSLTNDDTLLHVIRETLPIRRHINVSASCSLHFGVRSEYLKQLRARRLHY